jgi:hypothetical protein
MSDYIAGVLSTRVGDKCNTRCDTLASTIQTRCELQSQCGRLFFL